MTNSGNGTKNRRKDPRVNTDVEIKIANILFKDDDHFRIGKTKNLSCSGMYCNVNKFIEPLTRVEGVLKLPVEDDKNLHAAFNGAIVRIEPEENVKNCKDYNIAIFFQDMAMEDKKKISKYLTSANPD